MRIQGATQACVPFNRASAHSGVAAAARSTTPRFPCTRIDPLMLSRPTRRAFFRLSLAPRLRTSVDEKRGHITIRLADCPSKDAVALLSAVIDASKASAWRQGAVEDTRRLRELERFRRAVALQQAGAAGVAVVVSGS